MKGQNFFSGILTLPGNVGILTLRKMIRSGIAPAQSRNRDKVRLSTIVHVLRSEVSSVFLYFLNTRCVFLVLKSPDLEF